MSRTLYEGFITGKGRFGEELSDADRMKALIQGVGPTSFATHLPKILDEQQSNEERFRRGLRFFGIDVEKRNPDWIRSSVKKRLEQKIANKEDTTATINAIKAIGFDPDVMLKSIQKKLDKGKPIEKKKATPKDTAVSKALASYGF